MKKDIVITGYDMKSFYSAGIFQTTLAYATAYKKMGHNVKIVIGDKANIDEYKIDPKDKLVWLGIEYISTTDLLKMENVDYIMYMGFKYSTLEEGANGLYESLRDKFPKSKFIYASFYNIPSGIVAGITNESGFLSVKFNNFVENFDELWVLESHIKGSRELLSNTYKCVREMPLLVLDKEDYIEEYYNNKVPPIDIKKFKYDYKKANPNILLNLDPHSRMKHGFVPIIGSLKWIREKEGRNISLGNAFPLWINSDGNTNEEIFAYFKKYMSKTLTANEYYNMINQNKQTPIKMFGRQPTHNAMIQINPFAVIICIIGDWERWNVLLMDLFRFGIPVIHNFKEIDIGWKYDFPDTKALDDAIRQCEKDIFENDKYESYAKEANELFKKLSTLDSNKEKLENLFS